MKLLFDEHCAGTYKGGRAEIEKKFTAICVGHHSDLLAGMENPEIMDYARRNGYTVVTRDADFVKRCCDNNVRVAVLRGNQVFLIENALQIIGKELPQPFFSNK